MVISQSAILIIADGLLAVFNRKFIVFFVSDPSRGSTVVSEYVLRIEVNGGGEVFNRLIVFFLFEIILAAVGVGERILRVDINGASTVLNRQIIFFLIE